LSREQGLPDAGERGSARRRQRGEAQADLQGCGQARRRGRRLRRRLRGGRGGQEDLLRRAQVRRLQQDLLRPQEAAGHLYRRGEVSMEEAKDATRDLEELGPKETLSRIGQEVREAYARNKRVMSFDEFYALFAARPEQYTRTSAQYLKDVFDHFGTSEVRTP